MKIQFHDLVKSDQGRRVKIHTGSRVLEGVLAFVWSDQDGHGHWEILSQRHDLSTYSVSFHGLPTLDYLVEFI